MQLAELQFFAFINRKADQEDLVGTPLAASVQIPGTRKGRPDRS